MDQGTIDRYGAELDSALQSCKPVVPLKEREPGITVDDAYKIQLAFVEHRLRRGERVVGRKVGLTNRAVQEMLGVEEPDFGHLLSGMAYGDGATLPFSAMISPRAEGEIAFVLGEPLQGPGLNNADVLRATQAVMPCFEIVDSRIADWKIAIEDTVADNASSGAFVLGSNAVDPREVDLKHCGLVLEKNGEIVATGAGAAALGSPVNSVAWLANTLGRYGISLEAGEVILSGSLVPLIPVAAGDHLRVTIGGIGSVSVRFGTREISS